MDFSDALKAMKEGKKVNRREWNAVIYCYFDKGDLYIKHLMGEIEILQLNSYAVLAEDWEVIEDIPKAEVQTSPWYKCPHCKTDVAVLEKDREIVKCLCCQEEVKLVRKEDSVKIDYSNFLYMDPTVQAKMSIAYRDAIKVSEDKVIEKYKEWLQSGIKQLEGDIEIYVKNEDYDTAVKIKLQLKNYKKCLEMLDWVEGETH